VKSKLFTPLFTAKSKGQGFGLAVVKRLVEAQGGKNKLRKPTRQRNNLHNMVASNLIVLDQKSI
jgi:nitrogen fixation/metabolism regulation signal transduction histidine kinase